LYLRGPTSKGREGKTGGKEGGEGKGLGKGRGAEMREGEGPAPQIFWLRTVPDDTSFYRCSSQPISEPTEDKQAAQKLNGLKIQRRKHTKKTKTEQNANKKPKSSQNANLTTAHISVQLLHMIQHNSNHLHSLAHKAMTRFW